MNKTIMILANSDSGFYDFRKELLTELLERGFQVAVSVPDGNYRERIQALGCDCIPTAIDRRGINPVKDTFLFLRYLRLLRHYRPVVVLMYTIKPNIYGGMACRLRHIPYLANITGLGTALEREGRLQNILLKMYRAALKKAHCVFFQNSYNRNFMMEKKCVYGRTRLIPGSGVNLQERAYMPYPSEQNGIRVLSVVRVMRTKGITELLAVIPSLKKEFPKVVFEMAGAYEEDERAAYEPLIRDLQEKNLLRYYGYREDLQQIVENSHIIVHPTYAEGMSNVLLEAAAAGRPMVASNIQGCREIYTNGVSGIACEPRNTESLLQAMRTILLKTEAERRQMGIAARQQAEEKFDRKKVVAAYLDEVTDIASSY